MSEKSEGPDDETIIEELVNNIKSVFGEIGPEFARDALKIIEEIERGTGEPIAESGRRLVELAKQTDALIEKCERPES